MKSNWNEVKIDDICSIRRGASPRPIQKYISERGIPWVKIADATSSNSRFINETKEFIIEEGKEKSRYIEKGTLILSNSATPGLPKFMNINGCVHDGWLILDGFKGVYDNFLYYNLIENRIKLLSLSNGSVFRNLKTDIVKNFNIKLPPLEEQKSIAKILSDLDEKIEVNNKINKNLEEMAQAIFKQWFVDFEFPNEEGKPYKSSGGEMVESELGIIPKGWNCGLIENIATVIGGATPSKKNESYFINGNIPWVTPKDLSDNKNIYISKGTTNITKEAYKSTSVKFMPRNTVLFSSRAPIGYIAIAKNELTTNQGFKSLVPNNDIGMTANYIYCFLKSIKKSIENRASGSTFKEISGSELKKIEVIIPAKGILQKYYKFTENIFWEIENIESENERLEKLRDTLLPKLMSGEIRVPLENSEN